jgi:hypothetical protein
MRKDETSARGRGGGRGLKPGQVPAYKLKRPRLNSPGLLWSGAVVIVSGESRPGTLIIQRALLDPGGDDLDLGRG